MAHTVTVYVAAPGTPLAIKGNQWGRIRLIVRL